MGHNQKIKDAGLYHIRVKGLLDEKWSSWFSNFTISTIAGEESLLIGCVEDQSALHGLLNKIRDIGLPLLSLRRMDRERGE